MHQPIWEGLEAYLAGKPSPAFLAHLEVCQTCESEVSQIEEQARLFHSLRAPEPVDPPQGFYARVLDRIESQRNNSIWGVFLEPVFFRRLAYSTAVLTLLLGVFLFTSPKEGAIATTMPEQILVEEAPPAAELVDLEQDRNTVFVQLASFQE
jgi:hypothetical protein